MARNGVGVYQLPAGQPVVTGTTISSATHNTLATDLANALTTSIATDGQSVVTANIPLAGYKITGAGAATVNGDLLRFQQLFSQGAPVSLASAATTDIGAQTSVAVEISGITTITSFGANYNGPRFLRFTGALLLTHNATTLNLPGGANITTAAGDTAIAYPNLAGNGWNVTSYQRAANLPIYPGDAAVVTSLNLLSGFLFGCILSTAGSSATMSISAGKAQDSTGAQTMSLSAIAKTTSAWSVGTAAGGLDTGSIAGNTGYHFYVIRRPDTGVVDVTFSTNATTPTLPTNYTQYRRIGWGFTNGSNQWFSFVQDGDFFQWASPPVDVNLVSAGTAAVLRTLSIPIGVRVRALLNAQMSAGGSGEILYISDPATTDLAPTSAASSPINTMFTGASQTTSAQVMVRTNTSGQVRTRQAAGGATETFRMATIGWFDTRGRDA